MASPSQDDMHKRHFEEASLDSIRVLDVVGETEEGKSLWIGNPTQPLYQSVEPLSKGIHRLLVPVYDGNYEVHHENEARAFQLCTQTDVIRFILNNIERDKDLYDFCNASAEELGLVNDPTSKKVATVEKDADLFPVLRAMADQNLPAVPIIHSNENPILVGTLSVSDLRSVSGRAEVSELVHEMQSMTVASFLKKTKSLELDKPVGSAVVCLCESTLSEVMQLALASRVHRVWCIGRDGRPKGVVSYTDMIRAVCAHFYEKRASGW